MVVEELVLPAKSLDEAEGQDGLLPPSSGLKLLYLLGKFFPHGHESRLVVGIELPGHFQQYFFHSVFLPQARRFQIAPERSMW
jgi:hypothetical protein